jgi:hypothetical protein
MPKRITKLKGDLEEWEISGGEGGIRTPGRSFGPYNGLANRRIQPLCHLSADGSAGNSGRRIEYSIKKGIERAGISQGISLWG